MPGGDRTGPLGLGPGSGRGFGFCAGFVAVPGYNMFRRGYRMFRTRGLGRFNFMGDIPEELNIEKRKNVLNDQLKYLQEEMNYIQSQLSELDSAKESK